MYRSIGIFACLFFTGLLAACAALEKLGEE